MSRPVRGALLAWLEEMFAQRELEDVDLKPRRRAMFTGVPGVGKTTLAHHLAARLGLPMLCVQSEDIIESWLGATEQNIGALFRAVAKAGDVILFFDEFDTLGARRENTRGGDRGGAQRAMNAAVNVLLRRIEQAGCMIIAATNYADRIDPAIWRRFDIHIDLDLPGQEERERIVERYLSPFGLPARPLRLLAEALATASPSLIRQLCEALKRNMVLGERIGWDMRKQQTLDRIVAAIQPHPDLGKPALWAHGASSIAVEALPWPLPMAGDLPAAEVSTVATVGGTVVPLHGR